VVVDATPEQARAGQRERGRTIRERAMRRHERRWARAELEHEPWTSVTRLRRRDEGLRAVAPAPHEDRAPALAAAA
jgi:hypothetical protein